MRTNLILQKIVQALGLDIQTIKEIYALADYPMKEMVIEALLDSSKEKKTSLCSYEELGVFLDGLITYKRGIVPQTTSDETQELTNNLILKKLRIALNLKDMETEIIFGLGEKELTKQQLSSLFRKETHKNFKPCPDELLIAFLDGLDEFYYLGDNIVE